MALPWTLAVLSLLPLLHAQLLACRINFTAPLTNATLDQVGARAPEHSGSCVPLCTSFCPPGLRSAPSPDSALFSLGSWGEMLASPQRCSSAPKLRSPIARSLSRGQSCTGQGGAASLGWGRLTLGVSSCTPAPPWGPQFPGLQTEGEICPSVLPASYRALSSQPPSPAPGLSPDLWQVVLYRLGVPQPGV